MCQVALEEIRKAQKIVSEFETFSREENFDCPNTLTGQELVQELKRALEKHLTQDEKLKTDADSCSQLVKVNIERLQQDFANFVIDSKHHIKYYKNPELCIHLGCKLATAKDINNLKLDPRKKYLKLIYEDNGPGIAIEKKKKIFEPFESEIKSSGLGLSIAKHTVHVHRGAIIENGTPGKGVRFEIYLPTKEN